QLETTGETNETAASVFSPTISAQNPEVTPTQLVATGETNETAASVFSPTISAQNPEVTPTQLEITGETNETAASVFSPTISTRNQEVPLTQLATTGELNEPDIPNSPQSISAQNPELTLTQLATTHETTETVKSNPPQSISTQTPEVASPKFAVTGETSEYRVAVSINTDDNQKQKSYFEVEDDANNVENLSPLQGFAIGGQVTQLKVDNHQPIAASDTIPAMLTPGEFVINSRDAQKNLPFLEYINKGGKTEDILSNPQAHNVQRPNETNRLNSSFLGSDIAKQRSSFTHNLSLNNSQAKNDDIHQKKSLSNTYASPPLIFKNANNNGSANINLEAPFQWSNVEELFNIFEHDDKAANFKIENDNSSEFQSYNVSKSQSYPHNKSNHLVKGFAEGGEVKRNDLSSEMKPITKTINNMPHDSKNDEGALESLAREIYSRLRQRLEIERERQGSYLGRLPW
ncbi:hypothetical protein H6G27_23110, partial [Nostoc linckia FACHB-104]|nr:hypothetical protein [Nostoc linckia FACHB-104]